MMHGYVVSSRCQFPVERIAALSISIRNYEGGGETLIQTIARMAIKRIETEHFRLCTKTTLATTLSSLAIPMQTGSATSFGLTSTRTIPRQETAALELNLPGQQSHRRLLMARTLLWPRPTMRAIIWLSTIASCNGRRFIIAATLSFRSVTSRSKQITSECQPSSTATQMKSAWRTLQY